MIVRLLIGFVILTLAIAAWRAFSDGYVGMALLSVLGAIAAGIVLFTPRK